ncbi:hypothetical protein CO046_05595 [Candidatus Peregrinibacteria bacterium CG_4_9_14_0_2_um_filter_53_11]|nr:MAG: hypothetical protein CO046_05595 [Candidatus Peregrinibacteria bacterium CG_4_9_14_0_2_um_filter_53_11]
MQKKTKIWIVVGIVALVLLALLSSNSETLEGNLSMVPKANEKVCKQLAEACSANGDNHVSCDNYDKLCTAYDFKKELPLPEAKSSATESTKTSTKAESTQTEKADSSALPTKPAPRPVRRVAPSAAPETDDPVYAPRGDQGAGTPGDPYGGYGESLTPYSADGVR